MATSLLALLDDIATLLDDVLILSKVAGRKTAGVLGDDLALNAEQVAGVRAERELPVVWAVAKGSMVNKAVIVPAAFALSLLLPVLIKPLLLVGGAFLCYEGAHKVAEKLLGSDEAKAQHKAHVEAVADPAVDLVAVERDKIKGAIRTDFILSAEIIVITLGTVSQASVATRLTVLCLVAVVMTVGVYGVVAGIVRLDDLGQSLVARPSAAAQAVGRGILAFAPRLMRLLSVAGTAAMFLVGGGIVIHTFAVLHLAALAVEGWAKGAGALGPALAFVSGLVVEGLVGLLVGAAIVGVVALVKKLRRKG